MNNGTGTESTPGSYRSILKSTSLVGGASVLNILIGMVRTKIVAMLLGTTGVGLMGMYIQIIGLIQNISGMGLRTSGVRQIAEAVSTGDENRIACTVTTLRRTVWFTGGLGMLAMIIFCAPLSWISFNSNAYILPIAILGSTILLSAITSGQDCILQGTRKVADIAKISVIGAINGTLICIPCFYLWGIQGIVASLILSAAATLATSWWFARRMPVKSIAVSWQASLTEARQLLTVGFGFMGAGLVTIVSSYLIRVLILRRFGLDNVGIYQSAFALSGLLVGFVLAAMGTDYYPRLTAVANNNASMHRMVNEQTEISILLSLPCLAAMMVFAPLLIRYFYSESFMPAVPILRWCILGVLGRVISWPLAFVILAKGKSRLFFITELLAATVHTTALYYFTSIWGLIGAGIAFMVQYIFYTMLMLFVMRRLIGTTWNSYTSTWILFLVGIMIFLMLSCSVNFNPTFLWILNISVLGVVTVICINQLLRRSRFKINTLFAMTNI